MLPPLGIIFGLFVAFTAAQVWTDNERANTAVDREASALRAVVVLAATFPGEPESRLRAFVRRHIEQGRNSGMADDGSGHCHLAVYATLARPGAPVDTYP